MLNITHYQRNANQNQNEVGFHASQNGCDPKVYNQYMLERVWRNGNPLTLLVGMKSSTATMENSVAAAAAKSLQLCPTLCNPIDGSPPGFSVHGILQARTLEWVATSFSNA